MNFITRAEALATAKKSLNLYVQLRAGSKVDLVKLEHLLAEAYELLQDFVANDKSILTQGLDSFADTEIPNAINNILMLTDLSKPSPTADQLTHDHRALADAIDPYMGSNADPVRRQVGAIEDLYDKPAFEATVSEREVRELIAQLCDAHSVLIVFVLLGSALGVIQARDQDLQSQGQANLIDWQTVLRVGEIAPYSLLLRSLSGSHGLPELPGA